MELLPYEFSERLLPHHEFLLVFEANNEQVRTISSLVKEVSNRELVLIKTKFELSVFPYDACTKDEISYFEEVDISKIDKWILFISVGGVTEDDVIDDINDVEDGWAVVCTLPGTLAEINEILAWLGFEVKYPE
jgi:hypothetical protein